MINKTQNVVCANLFGLPHGSLWHGLPVQIIFRIFMFTCAERSLQIFIIYNSSFSILASDYCCAGGCDVYVLLSILFHRIADVAHPPYFLQYEKWATTGIKHVLTLD